MATEGLFYRLTLGPTWFRVVLEKLLVAHLVNKFLAFHVARKFIIVFGGSCPPAFTQALATGPYPELDECSPRRYKQLFSRPILILSLHPDLQLQNGHIYSYFPTKILQKYKKT
jgi:hypothetical protein